jgi:hypothetical protein
MSCFLYLVATPEIYSIIAGYGVEDQRKNELNMQA